MFAGKRHKREKWDVAFCLKLPRDFERVANLDGWCCRL